MRVVAAFNIVISEDNDQLQQTTPPINVIIDDTLPTGSKCATYNIAANAAEAQFLFTPEVTNGKYLFLQVLSGEITYKLNSNTAPAVGLKPNPAVTPDPILPYQVAAQPGVFFTGPLSSANPLTQLWIHNVSSSVPARISIALVGEAV